MELKPEDRRVLVELEETLWRAETRYDTELMERTFAPDFVEVGRSGRRYERHEMLFEPDPEAVINASLPLLEYSVKLISPDVALATYTSVVRYGDDI